MLIKLQKKDGRIKIINHSKNLGAYHSRVEGVLNSKSKYILFLDPDDLIFNPFLFEEIYKSYLKYNLDIIEYTVFYLRQNNKVFYINRQIYNHYHNFTKKIIYQPELSNILYYKPNSKNYSTIICRPLWNKIIKRNILLKTIKYIGNSYYKDYYIIVTEDALLNIIIYNFANNYNIRNSSITHTINNDILIKKSISFFLFYLLFYRLIKDFDKDRNYLYYDLRLFGRFILNLKTFNNTFLLNKAKIMFNEILNDKKTSKEFKNYIKFSYKSILK